MTPAPADNLPRRIAKMPEHLINQIAAGEVIERPSAAVKELVENALDAGSGRIEVRLVNGGLEEIQVLDDGCGIPSDDLVLAIARHATSKLAVFEDLERIGTYGFRGEALSSIASVAELTLRTKTREADTATVLYSVPGKPAEISRAAGPEGTLVTVRGLFASLPARQKFLKSSATELSHCQKMVRDLALGNPQVSFSLFHNGRSIFSVPKGDRLARFTECLKPAWSQPALHLYEEQPDFRIECLLSPAEQVQDRGECLFFINGRAVRSKTLSAAVRNIYLECLGNHHDPSGVVYVDIRKDWVDVNVHPQKLEVRILKQESLYQWLVASLRKRLSQVEPQTAPAIPKGTKYLFDKGGVEFLGQMQNGLLMCEFEGDLLLVDPHALHALQIMRKLGEQVPLTKPVFLSLTLEQFQRWEREKAELSRLGFVTESFGGTDILVQARPKCLAEEKIEPFLRSPKERLSEALACAAASLSAGPGLIQSAPPEWFASPPDWVCRHGHRLYFRLTSAALRKHFEI